MCLGGICVVKLNLFFQMEKFFEDNPEAGAGEAARGEAIENVSYNIKWLENNEKAIETWLDSNNNV